MHDSRRMVIVPPWPQEAIPNLSGFRYRARARSGRGVWIGCVLRTRIVCPAASATFLSERPGCVECFAADVGGL